MSVPAVAPQGFPQPSNAGYVAISPLHRIEATTTTNSEPLWTQYMDSCITVATYNTDTKLRSLCHLPGGQYESLIPQLAGIIDESTLVIFTNGTSGSKQWLETQKDNIMGAIETRLNANGKEGGVYRVYHTDPSQDASGGLIAGTFVIQPDGRYGRIQAPRNQAQGQTPSRDLQGGEAHGSRGKNGRKAKNRGFWRKILCCCFK
ncbi:hypothetical protein INS49_004423 [Diaporthe citri]|uniref:uncharacterized protein n=1 Tax=Diaporthe citri TaxID=83186 RepID=UPI001C7E3861|nr:uncharacterized protein INS49_004423 [Diaporthe citri]KAG6354406.1 hypothetical protein INS49_004423 [Diaporthe citri]